ncbi:hypothetical protein [Sphingomonas sp. YR710]|uniref:HoxN/HupN/NixA family nickel/cobalt transporter n=1 Tax=Sphingomonas sp. YR710 TaxID=1882773 RepID=UPI000A665D65|nr:hypothetical protein [Sphingomonas sp. YR710]
MPSLTDLLASGNAWLFIPTAILIGALHGLEPGHSKTMMAAFIIAVRGTVAQAVLLGVSAAISHSLVVWIVALGGQYLGQNLNAGTTEPYLQIASAVIVLGVGLWMIWRTRRDTLEEAVTTTDTNTTIRMRIRTIMWTCAGSRPVTGAWHSRCSKMASPRAGGCAPNKGRLGPQQTFWSSPSAPISHARLSPSSIAAIISKALKRFPNHMPLRRV